MSLVNPISPSIQSRTKYSSDSPFTRMSLWATNHYTYAMPCHAMPNPADLQYPAVTSKSNAPFITRNRDIRAPRGGRRAQDHVHSVQSLNEDQELRRGCARIVLKRFHPRVGEEELVRSKGGLSSGFVEDCVDERGRPLLMASWSASTSSSRTSQSDMRSCVSLGSRISMNLEGVSRILVGFSGIEYVDGK